MTRSRFAIVAVLAAFAAFVALSSAPVLAVAPTNDNLFFVEPISLGTYETTGSNVDATLEGGEPLPACENNFSRSVWYKHTAAANASLTVSTEGSGFDTILAVYSGPEVNPTFVGLVPVGCKDDDVNGSVLTSTVTFSALAGVTYYIQAGSFGGLSGSLFVTLGQIPPNDNLASALPVAAPHAVTVNTILATDEGGESFPCGGFHAVWFKADLAAGSYVARNTSGLADAVIAVYSGPSVSPTFPSLTLVGCNDDSDASLNSRLNFVAVPGTYYFQVGSFGEGNLTFTLNAIPDADFDGIPDQSDNCPYTQNGPNQTQVIGVGNQFDNDGDGVPGTEPPYGANWGGDACDFDDDNDGIPDTADAFCPFLPEDFDEFQDGDGCPDSDNDLDGVLDAADQGQMCFDPNASLFCPIQTCRNVAEDFDAFKDLDGCPEPDNDNDGFADASDQCPGANLHTGVDGMLGSPEDDNHNGKLDPGGAGLGEDSGGSGGDGNGVLTTDDVFQLMFEDYDTVLDIDGCHDSPGDDRDGDGYTDEDEVLKIGTLAEYPCGINGWPSNLFDGGASANRLTIQDVTSFVAPVRHFDSNPGDEPLYNPRWDIRPGAGALPKWINIQDVLQLVAGPSGNPPMMGGARAFGQSCPLPPQ